MTTFHGDHDMDIVAQKDRKTVKWQTSPYETPNYRKRCRRLSQVEKKSILSFLKWCPKASLKISMT